MATRGFEWAYSLDGSNATPVIRDFTLGVAAAHAKGDLMVMQSDGYLDQAAATATEVTCVCQETLAAAAITAGTTKAKCAIITKNQVWRCSADTTTLTGVIGYTKANDIVDCNTIDGDNIDHGPCIIVESDATNVDESGNVIAYVCFPDTTFGNA